MITVSTKSLSPWLTPFFPRSLVSALVQSLGYAKLPPRDFSSVRLLGRADANVVGGVLLGCGMALAGACPGTVIPQAALGVTPGRWTLAGGLLGGLAWSAVVRPWVVRRNNAAAAAAKSSTHRPSLTVYESLGVSYAAALVAAEVVLGVAVKMAMGLGGSSSSSGKQQLVHPVTGGVLIASAQLVSLLARKAMLGSSTAFEEAADHLLWLWRRQTKDQQQQQPRPKSSSLVFAAGMALGAYALGRWCAPAASAAAALLGPTTAGGSAARAALGGFLMIVGSRLAGGCTSGHGISGMSLLSLSSMVTIGSAFASGIVLSTGFLS